MEKYMNFTLGKHLRFSFQFMSSSLDKLVENLSDEAFKASVNENLSTLLDFGFFGFLA